MDNPANSPDLEIADAFQRNTDHCTCYGEGRCQWCKEHCLLCGGREEIHPISSAAVEGILPGLPSCEAEHRPHEFVSGFVERSLWERFWDWVKDFVTDTE